MDYLIRTATPADASAISRTIIHTLRESNALDYSSDIIDQVEQSFSPRAVLDLLARRQVFVTTLDGHIVATASLDHDVVRSVFVDPRHQGLAVGRHLMEQLQTVALSAGIDLLRVPSSITAEGFYAALGFKKVRDEYHQAERTIIMAKALGREQIHPVSS
ncbi:MULTISPECIES: GNAT family N-acetyltransferase [unclassified Pseudomonas]|uniref:GNAT family N-acetyltransferase n=1 Tax=unclassified Pseudomonas TaxID=196821 RepID=UPI001912452D|nr:MULTISPECIES: GNAT family N-acetyltransferase [unclassified Pseudomonas]MBK5373853.1 GNAT family N-acetyltransferase [Pseudomonas sp. TH43]MBK5512618.1 GNAT family N-acetyltransferase [Pseudomonas sp. TH15]